MTDAKKRRLSMLNGLAQAPAAPTQSMMSTNRALRSARDAVDNHRVWDLAPESIDDTRFKDRLDPHDVADLRASIEANGQTVPVLVRRDPNQPDTYLLVYGRRRLEAVRSSDKVAKVRALITTMDDTSALRAQVAENTARRDLTYIERALFAQELLASGFGNQSQVAEVLNTTKSAISMAISVANGIGADLARAIGPAPGIGRPRWEALAADLHAADIAVEDLIATAELIHESPQDAPPALPDIGAAAPDEDRSVKAFATIAALLSNAAKPQSAPPAVAKSTKATANAAARIVALDAKTHAEVLRRNNGLRLDLHSKDKAFLDWLDQSAPEMIDELITDLHRRWLSQSAK